MGGEWTSDGRPQGPTLPHPRRPRPYDMTKRSAKAVYRRGRGGCSVGMEPGIIPTFGQGGLCMQCVLGVDGGNTKTVALVAALDGTILGAGRGGCGDIYNARPGTGSSSTVVAPLVGSEAGGLITLHDGTLLDGLVPTQDSSAAAIANIEYAVMRALQAAQIN